MDAEIYISIHAPRAGGDSSVVFFGLNFSNFNPRPPCGGRPDRNAIASKLLDFNPRPPCGGRPCSAWGAYGAYSYFNPRPPCGGRPHALKGGLLLYHFNPRPPCGGRQERAVKKFEEILFQSTPPVRGATTRSRRGVQPPEDISIHAPRAGGDADTPSGLFCAVISIHAPRAGGDCFPRPRVVQVGISIHAPRAGGDSCYPVRRGRFPISIHAPRAGGDRQARGR